MARDVLALPTAIAWLPDPAAQTMFVPTSSMANDGLASLPEKRIAGAIIALFVITRPSSVSLAPPFDARNVIAAPSFVPDRT